MKRWYIAPLVLPFLLVPALWFIRWRARQTAAYMLVQYPRSPAIASTIRAHIRLSRMQTPGFHLYTTWITDAQSLTRMDCDVDSRGVITNHRRDWDNRSWDQGYKMGADAALGESTFRSLQACVRQLPPNAPPKREVSLIVISWSESDDGETRIYDRAHIPPMVKEIYRITGAPAPSPTK